MGGGSSSVDAIVPSGERGRCGDGRRGFGSVEAKVPNGEGGIGGDGIRGGSVEVIHVDRRMIAVF